MCVGSRTRSSWKISGKRSASDRYDVETRPSTTSECGRRDWLLGQQGKAQLGVALVEDAFLCSRVGNVMEDAVNRVDMDVDVDGDENIDPRDDSLCEEHMVNNEQDLVGGS